MIHFTSEPIYNPYDFAKPPPIRPVARSKNLWHALKCGRASPLDALIDETVPGLRYGKKPPLRVLAIAHERARGTEPSSHDRKE